MQLVEVAVPDGNMESPMNPKLISRSRTAGFSLIEILIVVAIGFVLAAVAIPQAMGAYRTYKLNSAASQVAGILKFTRLEAIRQNKPVSFRSQVPAAGLTRLWTDEPTAAAPAGDGAAQPTENQILLNTNANFVAIGGVPNTAAITAALAAPALVGLTPAATFFQFDQRGAVNPPAVYAICIQNTGVPTAGYRAVIIMPSGAVQIWTADNAGNWRRTS